ncbi:hypothetical protein [Nocardioides sp. W7]|uniref:WD40 repeat domain-containing protein n=1 Tax=Nocardioides sp. W7 TaxID=2931390 RepID=UPI001FD550A8|nr:hypothetical protein [Nocardioides sp. W7]
MSTDPGLRLLVDLEGLDGTSVALDRSGAHWALGDERRIQVGDERAVNRTRTDPPRTLFGMTWSEDGPEVRAGTCAYDQAADAWVDPPGLEQVLREAAQVGLADSPDLARVEVAAAAASADGRELVVATRYLRSRGLQVQDSYYGPSERLVALRSSAAGSWTDSPPVVLLAGHAESRALAVGSRFIAAGGDTVRVWERETRDLVAELPHEYVARDLAFDADGGRLAVLTATGALALWDVSTAERLASWSAHDGDGYAVALHPAGELLATGGQDGRLRLWTPEGTLVHEERHEGWVQAVAFSGDGTRLAASTWARPPHLLVYEVALPGS